jgi:integrase
MPPELVGVLEACPTTKTWRTPGHPPQPDLTGARERALLLVGFVPALRRSELVGLSFEHVNDDPQRPGSHHPPVKANQGIEPDLVVLPIVPNPARCPARALRALAALAGIASGPILRAVSTGSRAGTRRLDAGALNVLVQKAVARAGIEPLPYSAHSLRAGFVTHAHLRGAATGPSSTRRATAPWPPWGSTLGSTRRGKTTWQRNLAFSLRLWSRS